MVSNFQRLVHSPSQRRAWRRAALLAFLVGAAIILSRRLGAADSTPPKSTPSIDVPMAPRAPLVTAAPDDPAWEKAASIDDLTLSAGAPDGLPPVPRTIVQALWDDQFLYVRFTCQDDEIYSPFHGHDAEYFKADVVEVFLDPVGDGREIIELEVSPDNGVFDQILLYTAPEMRSGPDGVLADDILAHDAWNFPCWDLPGLRTTAGRWHHDANGTRGWLVDLAIPCSVLRRTSHPVFAHDLALRANFLRYDWPLQAGPGSARLFMPLNWSTVVAGRPHRSPARMGTLHLIGP